MIVLGIESSCDETAAAIVRDGVHVLSNVVRTQIAKHRPFGGVVPEIASRCHLEAIGPVVEAALADAGLASIDDVDGIAVTARPGLIGSLLVGVSFAKGLAVASGKPLIDVDHIEAHIYANLLAAPDLEAPFVSLIASGGHTAIHRWEGPGRSELIGRTRDDAAGEAFDKAAALLGLGYPGGPAIERAARDGDPGAVHFPRARVKGAPLDFSFSGIKTAVLYHLHGPNRKRSDPIRPEAGSVADVAASFQEAVCDVLADRTVKAARAAKVSAIAVGGGVACNGRLREKVNERARGLRVVFPAPALCTDNAAMIAGLGHHALRARLEAGAGPGSSLDFDARPR